MVVSMNVLILNGSPHKKGSTYTALHSFLAQATASSMERPSAIMAFAAWKIAACAGVRTRRLRGWRCQLLGLWLSK